MELRLEWSRPIPLKDGSSQSLIYTLDVDNLPKAAGIYVFGRRYARRLEARYVGQARDIRGRIRVQLNNLRLMRKLQTGKAGERILLIGQFFPKGGQKTDKCLSILERALIRHFLIEGHDLVNKQGTRLLRHEISSTGRQPRSFIASLMYVERGKAR